MIKKIALTLLITLVFVEAILWIGFRQGHQPVIDIHMTQDIPGLSHNVHFQKNALGLRSNTIHSKKKENGAYRIIVIGASTAEQATQDNNKTWAIQLEKLLQKKFPDKKIELGIYATGGKKTHELLHWANQHLLDLKPDFVITLLGINNLVTDRPVVERGDVKLAQAYIESSPPLNERLSSFSQIARYVRNIRSNNKRLSYSRDNNGANFDVAGIKKFRQRYWGTPVEENPTDFPDQLFREQTKWLLAFLKKHQIDSLTLTQPSLYKPQLDVFQEGTQITLKNAPQSEEEASSFLSEIKSLWFILNTKTSPQRLQPSEMLKALNILNDTQMDVAASLNRSSFPLHNHLAPTHENFFDDCHFTDLGSTRIAELLLEPTASIINSQK